MVCCPALPLLYPACRENVLWAHAAGEWRCLGYLTAACTAWPFRLMGGWTSSRDRSCAQTTASAFTVGLPGKRRWQLHMFGLLAPAGWLAGVRCRCLAAST
jgi:hypothetical protein